MKLRQVLFLSTAIGFYCASASVLCQTPQPAPAPVSSTAPSSQDDAASAAAARRKRFEEDKAALENSTAGESQTSGVTNDGSSRPCIAEGELVIGPNFVNMFLGFGSGTQSFDLFDRTSHERISHAEWSIDDSYVADLIINEDGSPVLAGKHTGRVRLTARVGSRTGEAHINVVTREDMASGAITEDWLYPPDYCPKSGATTQWPPPLPRPALCTAADIELLMDPRFLDLPIGKSQRFLLLDSQNHNVAAQAEWSVDDSYVAELAILGSFPMLTGKQTGTVHLTARLGSRTREATIYVFARDPRFARYPMPSPPPPCLGRDRLMRPVPSKTLPTDPADSDEQEP